MREISRKNPERLLRKWQKAVWDTFCCKLYVCMYVQKRAADSCICNVQQCKQTKQRLAKTGVPLYFRVEATVQRIRFWMIGLMTSDGGHASDMPFLGKHFFGVECFRVIDPRS